MDSDEFDMSSTDTKGVCCCRAKDGTKSFEQNQPGSLAADRYGHGHDQQLR